MSTLEKIKDLLELNSDSPYTLGSYSLELLPQLIQEHEALLRFVEAVKEIDIILWAQCNCQGSEAMCTQSIKREISTTIRDEWNTKRDSALTQLDKELKG